MDIEYSVQYTNQVACGSGSALKYLDSSGCSECHYGVRRFAPEARGCARLREGRGGRHTGSVPTRTTASRRLLVSGVTSRTVALSAESEEASEEISWITAHLGQLHLVIAAQALVCPARGH